MTRAEARRRAVEAAARAMRELAIPHTNKIEPWEAATQAERDVWLSHGAAGLDAAERAMADAGWRMGRDVAHLDGVGEFMVADNERMRQAMVWARMAGWNACRAAMLADPDA